ncbi:hypothetical protein GBA52_028321 [Prunus armeniaca]|nr:hypothetical protein GBA52_028321 [Prunus armeniaca]
MASEPLDHVADQDRQSSPISNDFNPSGYETNVYEVAKMRNTIAVVETGSGKDMVAAMLINDIGQAIKSSGAKKKLIVFLTPTVHLVHQQFEVVKVNTNFKVEEYYGAKGLIHGLWSAGKRKQMSMINDTPDSFGCLEKGILELESGMLDDY